MTREKIVIVSLVISLSANRKMVATGSAVRKNTAYTLTGMDKHAVSVPTYQNVVGALCSGDEKSIGNQYVNDDKCIVESTNLIRRLTLLECGRLQGYPDGWTNTPSASDSARYKAQGNSVAIPFVEFIMGGIALILKAENEKRRRRGWRIILAFPILGGNMFTPDVIWSLATCGLCIILLVVSHNEPWKRED